METNIKTFKKDCKLHIRLDDRNMSWVALVRSSSSSPICVWDTVLLQGHKWTKHIKYIYIYLFQPRHGRIVLFPNIRNNQPEIKIVENMKFSTREFTNIFIPIYFMISLEAYFLGFKVCSIIGVRWQGVLNIKLNESP